MKWGTFFGRNKGEIGGPLSEGQRNLACAVFGSASEQCGQASLPAKFVKANGVDLDSLATEIIAMPLFQDAVTRKVNEILTDLELLEGEIIDLKTSFKQMDIKSKMETSRFGAALKDDWITLSDTFTLSQRKRAKNAHSGRKSEWVDHMGNFSKPAFGPAKNQDKRHKLMGGWYRKKDTQ